MRKILLTLALCVNMCSICSASSFHDLQDSIGVDKFAHVGAGYIIQDQLERNCGFSTLEALATVTLLAYAKEKWIDDDFNKADIGATAIGGLMYQIEF